MSPSFLLSLLTIAPALDSALPQASPISLTLTTSQKGEELPVFQGTGGGFGTSNYAGEPNREADHATVAISPETLDILVVWHSDVIQSDFEAQPNPRPAVKHVEAMYLEHSFDGLGQHVWTAIGGYPNTGEYVSLLGDTTYNTNDVDPLLIGPASNKCERPSVTAVGEYFCVVWTRTYYTAGYGPGGTTIPNDPAITECVWVRKNGTGSTASVGVHGLTGGGAGFAGAGFPLSSSSSATVAIKVDECAGVADVAMRWEDDLSTPLVEDPQVVVLFVEQKRAGGLTLNAVMDDGYNDLDIGDGSRDFDVHLVECRFVDPAGAGTVQLVPGDVMKTVHFDGWTAKDGSNFIIDTGGLVLPELVRGADEDSFAAILEDQAYSPGFQGHTSFRGRIRLAFLTESGGWDLPSYQTIWDYSTGPDDGYRRRPMLSAFGSNSFFLTYILGPSAFPLNNGDVTLQEWMVSAGSLTILHDYNADTGFNHPRLDDTDNQVRPIVVAGSGGYRRCYWEQLDTGPDPDQCVIWRQDAFADDTVDPPDDVVRQDNFLGHVAADYAYYAAGVKPHLTVLTWEQQSDKGPVFPNKRIFIKVLGE